MAQRQPERDDQGKSSSEAAHRPSAETTRRGGSRLELATPRDRDRMLLGVLLVLAGGAAYLLIRFLYPFMLGIVTAGVVAALAHPVYERARRWVGNDSVAALLVTVGTLLLVAIPVGALLLVVARDLQSSVPAIVDRFEQFGDRQGRAWQLMDSVAHFLGVRHDRLAEAAKNQASHLGSLLAGGTLGLLSGLGGWLVQGGIGLFTLFYLLRDGHDFLAAGRWLIPLEGDVTDALLDRIHEVISATVLGHLLVALVQGTLGGIAFAVLGLPGPALWGGAMAFAGLLPAIGPPIVWVPTTIFLAAAGDWERALALAAIGALVIGTVDNVVRSLLVSGRAQLHPLVVFFSVLGGLVVFGAAGFLFGPILVVVALAVLEIARVALEGVGSRAELSTQATILSRVVVPRTKRPPAHPASS